MTSEDSTPPLWPCHHHQHNWQHQQQQQSNNPWDPFNIFLGLLNGLNSKSMFNLTVIRIRLVRTSTAAGGSSRPVNNDFIERIRQSFVAAATIGGRELFPVGQDPPTRFLDVMSSSASLVDIDVMSINEAHLGKWPGDILLGPARGDLEWQRTLAGQLGWRSVDVEERYEHVRQLEEQVERLKVEVKEKDMSIEFLNTCSRVS